MTKHPSSELARQAVEVESGIWEIPRSARVGMNVPARVLASPSLFQSMDEGVFNQVTNVATLPGIRRYALCMPDGHWGYGFPIGGVAAFDPEDGVISPGGIGFDINCGMRLIRTNLTHDELRPRLDELMDTLYSLVPCGVGGKGVLRLSDSEFRRMTTLGAKWCVESGYGRSEDLIHTEEGGCLAGADPDQCSDRAVERGRSQLGTLGSGNHYLEVQVVQPHNVYDEGAARIMGIDRPDQIVVMVHCGSRGFGHQVATDYLRVFTKAMKRFGIDTTDKELGCAPFRSNEGRDYFGAMNCAANSAFANRQLITHRIREGLAKVFRKSEAELGLDVIYDVCHNIAKLEPYVIDGKTQDLLVHRKGATRSFGPGDERVPEDYRSVGQPVIVGGSMETGSYLLVGTEKAKTDTFGSTLHGSGRVMSRTKARKAIHGDALRQDMLERLS